VYAGGTVMGNKQFNFGNDSNNMGFALSFGFVSMSRSRTVEHI